MNIRERAPLFVLVALASTFAACNAEPGSVNPSDLDSGLEDVDDIDAGEGSDTDEEVEEICEPGTFECDGEDLRYCSADGSEWLTRDCPEESACVAGVCAPMVCEPNEVLCGTDSIVVCNDEGTGYAEEACPEGQACFQGLCIECISDADCDSDQACNDGVCGDPALAVLTEELPVGAIDVAYEAMLEPDGGQAPYLWSLTAGALPEGLTLNGNGQVSGTPIESGFGEFDVQVFDGLGEQARGTITWQVVGDGVQIITERLPIAEDGLDYSAQFEAIGGVAPYAWQLLDGSLPDGLTLTSAGEINGTPNGGVGPFPITIRVLDSDTPPSFFDKDFTFEVEIAPLEIVGDQSYDLFVTTVVILPLMTPIQGIPVPYNHQLEARGGLRPYNWEETGIAQALQFLIPQAGLPDGLTLAADGTISGSVTDTSQVARVSIPFTGIELTGFFFSAEVTDSQESADRESGLFLIPTLPIGG